MHIRQHTLKVIRAAFNRCCSLYVCAQTKVPRVISAISCFFRERKQLIQFWTRTKVQDNPPSAHLPLRVEYFITKPKRISDNFRDFLNCRFEDINNCPERNTEWACQIVDLLDELKMMGSSLNKIEKQAIDSITIYLKRVFESHGGELICVHEWEPQLQRAVEVEHNLPDGSAIILNEHKAYGFKLNGKLIRKEEVTIKAPAIQH